MTSTRTARRSPAAAPASPRAAALGRRATSDFVTTVREVVRLLVAEQREKARDLAFDLLSHHANAAARTPVLDELRAWQLLAVDLSAAFGDADPVRRAKADALASELRAAVTMIARNPVDQLAQRPLPRRVLETLHIAGGELELTALRERAQLSGSHLSNILKPLVAHGLVVLDAVPGDARSKRAVLTERGTAEIEPVIRQRSVPQVYRDRIRIEPVATPVNFRAATRLEHSA